MGDNNYYVDKLEFHNALKEYNETKSQKSYNKIGKFFLSIAENYLNRPRYINYSKDWKDDMISEAVFDMCRYKHNYDVEKMEKRYEEYDILPDPFSYFSQYAFSGAQRLLKSKYADMEILVKLPFIENIDKKEM